MTFAKGLERKKFVDIAKGITILLVVVEHNVYIYKYHILAQVIILSFHMPLFYFVSGLFFSRNQSLVELTKKRFNSLLKPYFSSCLLFFILKLIKDQKIGDISLFFRNVLYGTNGSLSWPYQQLWFLTSLFVTVLVCKILYIGLSRFQLIWLRYCVLVAILSLWYFFIKQTNIFPNSGLPWNVDLIGITLFFYALGSEMNKWLFRIRNIPIYYIIASLLIFAIFHYYFTVSLVDPHAINLALRKYDNFFVNSIEAVSGILLTMFMSIALEKCSMKISAFFVFLGRRSLTIFVFHRFFMPYIEHAGKVIFIEDSFILFFFTVLLTIGLTILTHESIRRIPVANYLLINQLPTR